jgi:8-oxo-dGTP diphosphatase
VTQVQAAGGVVVRLSGSGGREVVLVHRPAYDDWTLPKGKLEPGEDLLQAALREVREETGLDCLLGPGLGSVEYVDASGRDKTAHYWAMAAAADGLAPTKEIDEARWVSFEDAAAELSYDRDRGVLARAAALLPALRRRVAVFLVGPAAERVEALAGHEPVLLVSGPAPECVRRLEPLGEACDLPVQRHDALSEGTAAAGALALLRAAATLGTAVASTHEGVQAAVIESLDAAAIPLQPGSAWELTLEDGRFSTFTDVASSG